MATRKTETNIILCVICFASTLHLEVFFSFLTIYRFIRASVNFGFTFNIEKSD